MRTPSDNRSSKYKLSGNIFHSISKEATYVFCIGLTPCIIELVCLIILLVQAYTTNRWGTVYAYLPYLDYIYTSVLLVTAGAALTDITAKEKDMLKN